MHAAQEGKFWQRYKPSQAMLVALAVGLILLCAFALTWLAYRAQPQRVAWSDYMQWPQFLSACGLGIVICIMTYWLVKLWHEELPAADRSLEDAWQAGLQALRKRGQDLEHLPLFLVLGAGGRQHQQALMEQSGLELLDAIVPTDSAAPLHWALTNQGVWLFIEGAGTYTALSERLALRKTQGTWFTTRASAVNEPTPDVGHSMRTAVASSSAHTASDLETISGQSTSATSLASTHSHVPISASLGSTATSALATAVVDEQDAALARSTMLDTSIDAAATEQLDQLEALVQAECQAESIADNPKSDPNRGFSPSSESSSPLAGESESERSHDAAWSAVRTQLAFEVAAQPGVLSSLEISRRQRLLQEVCRRLRSQRGAVAPTNGIVVVLDSAHLLAGPLRASELGLAVRSDLQLMQDQLQLQAPITVLVNGMENVLGTSELVRRGGPESAQQDTMGAAFPIRYQPEKHLIAHLCRVALGQLETHVYRHLQASHGWRQVGNEQLFQLLIACRSRLLPALQVFATEALAIEYKQETREPCLFAGIRFIASGSKVIERAWSHGAIAYILSSQNFLRWTDSHQRSEQRTRWIISLLKALCIALALTLFLSFYS